MTNVESSLKGSTWRGSSWHEKKLVGWWVVAKPTCFLGRIQVLFKTPSVYCKRKCVNNIATSPYLWLQIMTWQRLSGCSWRFWTTSSRTIRSDHSGSSKWSFRGSFVILNQGGRCGLRTCFETSQVTNVSPAKNFINSRIQNIPERYNKQYIYMIIYIYVYIILYNTYIYIYVYIHVQPPDDPKTGSSSFDPSPFRHAKHTTGTVLLRLPRWPLRGSAEDLSSYKWMDI